MGAKTDHFEGWAIKKAFGDAKAADAPATWYVALFTVAPGETGGGTEVSGGGYARVAVPNDSVNWDLLPAGATDANLDGVADDAIIKNKLDIVFPQATVDWGTVTHWGLFDAATGGNLWIYAPLTTAVTITASSTPKFAAGALSYQEDT